MKGKCIQTMLINSNKVVNQMKVKCIENKAYWIQLKPSALKQSQLNQMKGKCIKTNLNESNEWQVHSNNANWFK